jgi:hypothetical protein
LDTQGFALPDPLTDWSERVVLNEEGLYWIRPGSQTHTLVTRPEGTYELLPASEDLMLSPADGGPPQVVARGVLLTKLHIQGDGLYGTRPPEYPDLDGPGELYRFARVRRAAPSGATSEALATAAPVRLPYSIPNPDVPLDPTVGTEVGGDYFWLDGTPGSEGRSSVTGVRQRPGSPPMMRLMACRIDGSRPHLVCELKEADGTPLSPAALFAHNSRLYLACSRPAPQRLREDEADNDHTPRKASYIIHVRPDAADPLASRRTIGIGKAAYGPADVADADDDHYYFFATEAEASPLDFLSERSTRRWRTRFRRIQLPD